MCWFIIDPKTGRYGRHVKKPSHRNKLYLHNLAFDAFFDIGWAFEQFLAPHPRPPFDDLVAFVIDGHIPASLRERLGPELDAHYRAFQQFWASWDTGEDGYPALLGRPMLREEKYWLLEHWLRRQAVGREQFYAGKTVEREEWLVNGRAWDGERWKADCWGRLRVFSDGTADAWCPGLGVMAYDTEEGARRELESARYSAWDVLEEHLFHGEVPAPPTPAREQLKQQLETGGGPFRYCGTY